jgi:hypothetical protein
MKSGQVAALFFSVLVMTGCEPSPQAKVVNKTGLHVTFDLVRRADGYLVSKNGVSPYSTSVIDNFSPDDGEAQCADLSKLNFGVDPGVSVPAKKVIGTRDKEWCKGTWTIELLPASAAG